MLFIAAWEMLFQRFGKWERMQVCFVELGSKMCLLFSNFLTFLQFLLFCLPLRTADFVFLFLKLNDEQFFSENPEIVLQIYEKEMSNKVSTSRDIFLNEFVNHLPFLWEILCLLYVLSPTYHDDTPNLPIIYVRAIQLTPPRTPSLPSFSVLRFN